MPRDLPQRGYGPSSSCNQAVAWSRLNTAHRSMIMVPDCRSRSSNRIATGHMPQSLAAVYLHLKGQLSNLHRKTAECIALQFKTAPRTLQRFLESIKWDEDKLRDRCQQIVAKDHAHPEAIGRVDESGTTKSGNKTVRRAIRVGFGFFGFCNARKPINQIRPPSPRSSRHSARHHGPVKDLHPPGRPGRRVYAWRRH
jgi:hypothetical protein